MFKRKGEPIMSINKEEIDFEQYWEELEKELQQQEMLREYSDFFIHVCLEFEEMRIKTYLETKKDYSPYDIRSWYSLLGNLKKEDGSKKYIKPTIEEAFKRSGYLERRKYLGEEWAEWGEEEQTKNKKSQVEQVLQLKYKKSYRILLKNLEQAGIIEKSTTKQWKWNAKKIEFCFFILRVNKEYIKYIDGDSPKYTPFVADFEVENGITNKYIAKKISKLSIKTYDRIEKCFPKKLKYI